MFTSVTTATNTVTLRFLFIHIVIWTRCDILSLHGRCHYLFFCRQWTSYTQCVCTLLLHIYRGVDGVRVKAHVSLLNHHDAFTRFCFQWVHGILVSTNNYKMIYINGEHKRCPFNSNGMRGFNHHRWFIPTSNHYFMVSKTVSGSFRKSRQFKYYKLIDIECVVELLQQNGHIFAFADTQSTIDGGRRGCGVVTEKRTYFFSP